MKGNIILAKKVWGLLLTLIFCLSPQISAAALLNDLFAGGSYRFDNLLLTNWELVNAVNVNSNNIDIGPGYGNLDEFGVWSKNHELLVNQIGSGTPETLSLSFDFLVTGIGVDITQVAGDLGYGSVSGYSWDSPWISGSIAVGTSKGSNDLGSTTEVGSLTQNPGGTVWIDIPNGLNEIWVRNTISLSSSHHGYAEAGYHNGEEGPAFRNRFITQTAVPVPASIFLFGTGIAGLAGIRIRRKKK